MSSTKNNGKRLTDVACRAASVNELIFVEVRNWRVGLPARLRSASRIFS